MTGCHVIYNMTSRKYFPMKVRLLVHRGTYSTLALGPRGSNVEFGLLLCIAKIHNDDRRGEITWKSFSRCKSYECRVRKEAQTYKWKVANPSVSAYEHKSTDKSNTKGKKSSFVLPLTLKCAMTCLVVFADI